MRRIPSDLLLGGVIALVGVIILLQNLGLFGRAEDLIWALLLTAGGVAFLGVVVQNPARWWALIPGAALLSLGVLITLTLIVPAASAVWGGTIFLGGLGLGFFAVYLLRREFWWALIPAGVLLTLGVVAGIGSTVAGPLTGAVFFVGLAATFGLVAVLPPAPPRRWALIPAGVLLALAALVAVNTPAVATLGLPAVLILIGLALLLRAVGNNQRRRYEDQTVSQPH